MVAPTVTALDSTICPADGVAPMNLLAAVDPVPLCRKRYEMIPSATWPAMPATTERRSRWSLGTSWARAETEHRKSARVSPPSKGRRVTVSSLFGDVHCYHD